MTIYRHTFLKECLDYIKELIKCLWNMTWVLILLAISIIILLFGAFIVKNLLF